MNRTRAAVLVLVTLAAVGGVAALTVERPTVERTESRISGVNDSTTLVTTELLVENPNPVGVRLGNATVNHSVRMNGIVMGNGSREGLRITEDGTRVNFTTAIDNRKIPAWWASHVERGERTRLATSASVDVPVFGTERVSENRTVTTDITGALNTSEPRPINASLPLLDDPVLVVDRTTATWGNATPETTPLDIALRVRNPTEIPIPVSRIDYTVTMNGIPVANGTTGRGDVIPPGDEQTVRTRVAIRNRKLDEWWVSHIERNQHTDLRVSLTAVLDLPGDTTVRVPLDGLGYSTDIDTDVFGTKNGSAARAGTARSLSIGA
ncbi:LEA type 2 family protein [Halococcus sp. AFM35]|uniref:LEA type 2 family protein n=1 Tax=Halococcus sp. AFM35 TaxID=3421653 RepID=UPI003EBDF791